MSLRTRTSFDLADIWKAILEYDSVEKLWAATMGSDTPIHPIIRDLLERGIKKRTEDLPFQAFKRDWMKTNDTTEYRKIVNVEAKVEAGRVAINTGRQTQVSAAVAQATKEVLEYTNSVLTTFIFGGKELGMMSYSDVMTAIIQRKARSETEFKQVVFLEAIAAKLKSNAALKAKDIITPANANALWRSVEVKKLTLA